MKFTTLLIGGLICSFCVDSLHFGSVTLAQVSPENAPREPVNGRDILGDGPAFPAFNGDPITMIPQAVDLANQYGLVQGLSVLLVIFIFQYVRNAQKHAAEREEFFRQQLGYSDKRTTEELTRLSTKLGLMEQDLRSLQDRFDHHAELIRTNGQLCREIVSTMTAHNIAVEQNIAELGSKFESLSQAIQTNFRRRKDD